MKLQLDRFNDPEVLRRMLGAALRRAHEAKMTRERFARAVRDGARLALSNIRIPAVPKPIPDKRGGKEEVARAVFADWQLGKTTPSYNAKVCERRIELFTRKVIELTRIQRAHHPVRKLKLYGLGDLVEGELIFPGQQWRLDLSLNDQTIVTGPRILVNSVRRFLTEFEEVELCLVPGNHGFLGGRSRREMHPDSNADRMLYQVAAQLLRDEPRVKFRIANTANLGHWYLVDDIGGYRTLLFHGYNIKGGLVTENGIRRLVQGWQTGSIKGGFRDAMLGHWHVIKRFTFNGTAVRVVGSPESDNDYAIEYFGSTSRPSQHLDFVLPGKGVTCEYDVWLDDEDKTRCPA